MRINLLGATGVLGNGIFQKLIGTHDVKTFDSSAYNIEKRVYEAPGLYECDCLIHAAGVTDEEAKRDPVAAVHRASLACYQLIEECIGGGCTQFIYISSIHVYGTMVGQINVQKPTSPTNIYSACHCITESLFTRLSYEKDNRSLVCRVPTIYGYPKNIESLNRPTLIPYDFPKQLVSNEAIVLKSSGLQERNFCSNKKVGDLIKTWIETGSEISVCNISGDITMTVRSFADFCADIYFFLTQRKAVVNSLQGSNNEIPASLKVESRLDCKEKYELKDFVSDYISYLLAQQVNTNN